MIDNYYMTCPLAGESFDNADGTSRQEEIAICRVGEAVSLRHDEENPHDPNAVAVFSARGIQIGFLSRNDNAEYLSVLGEQRALGAEISAIYGGSEGKPNRGVEIDIECREEDAVIESYTEWRSK